MDEQGTNANVVWAVDVQQAALNGPQMQLLMGLLPQHDVDAVMAFKQDADQQRALVSRVAQRCVVGRVFGVQLSQISIRRTKGGKPYSYMGCNPAWAPNFNYNVSHEGRFVVLASSSHLLIGVDVAAPLAARWPRTQPAGRLASFKSCFAPSEWELLQAAPDGGSVQASIFQHLWSLKEAYVKARGDGLGFSPLSRACFRPAVEELGLRTWRRAELAVDGNPQTRWAADACLAPHNHVVSIVRGSPDSAVDAWGGFSSSFGQTMLTEEELAMHLASPPASLCMMSISDLLAAAGAHALAHSYLQAGCAL